MRILLINPPWFKRPENVWGKIDSVMPPLGLAWIASVLEKTGHQVVIFDAQAEGLTLEQFPDHFRALGKFHLVCITATTSLVNSALAIARMVKAESKAVRVVMGGVHPTVLPNEVLAESAVDLVVRGEGENTILDIAAEEPVDKIDGISYRQNGSVVHNPDRKLIDDLDLLPLPAYHLLPMRLYHPAAGAYKQLPATSVLATRGCPGKCTFCYRIFGNRLRVRSGKNVALEVKYLQDRFGVREICFYDDTFTVSHRAVRAFCQSLKDMNVQVTWSCFSRVDVVNEDLLRMMKDAGCHQIMYGVETASLAILKNINKRIDFAKIEEAVRISKKVGIDVRAAFMIGNPGETAETLEETFKFAVRLNPEIAIFNITTPFPGTAMFAWAKNKGFLKTENWEDYDLAHCVMRLPTISEEKIMQFYRQVHRRYSFRWKYLVLRLLKLRSFDDVINALRGLRVMLNV